MKTHPAPSARAFTLIELITVIAIIAVLMALLFPHFGAARESALRAKAKTVVNDVVNASNNYKNEYGKYPPVTEAREGSTTNPYMSFGDTSEGKCKVDNNRLLDILRAIARDSGDNQNHAMNPKQIKFTNGQKATGKPANARDGYLDGSEFEGNKLGQLMDPWGKQYCFILETDGDEILDLSNVFTDLTGKENYVRFSAVGYSLGKDSKVGGKGYENRFRKEKSTEPPDDVVSWQ